MLKVGLTGGIACGKSTVATVLKNIGVPVLDADQVARDVVAVGTEGLAEIKNHFGADICLSNGELDRSKLRDIILNSPEQKKRLESITHPRIFLEMMQWQQSQEKAGMQATVTEAALMVETGSYKMYDAMIVATCSPDIQLRRLMDRNNIPVATAQKWIASQMPLSDKVTVADVVIQNNDSIEELRAQTIQKWTKLLRTLS